MSFCKLTYIVHLYIADHAKDSIFGLQSDIFSKLRDPFRNPKLKHCLSTNKIET